MCVYQTCSNHICTAMVAHETTFNLTVVVLRHVNSNSFSIYK